ncbi:MAG TPA: transcriptional regulator, partial [Polyangia bacterium]|nr:transcriptional regulator [Polyangia bacterium]
MPAGRRASPASLEPRLRDILAVARTAAREAARAVEAAAVASVRAASPAALAGSGEVAGPAVRRARGSPAAASRALEPAV